MHELWRFLLVLCTIGEQKNVKVEHKNVKVKQQNGGERPDKQQNCGESAIRGVISSRMAAESAIRGLISGRI